MVELFFELVQIALGSRDKLSRVPSAAQWEVLYEEADRQAISGVLLNGLERLPREQWPSLELKLQWIGDGEMIRAQNRHVDEQTAIVWRQLKEAGLEAVVLKGQGVAWYYNNREKTKDAITRGELRQSGDIDIWVKGGYETVREYVMRTAPTDDVAYHRFHYPIFEDTEVELHFRPTLMRNLLDNRKLARWYDSFGTDSFLYLEEKGFAVPSAEFNRIFLLTHIYRHFLFEGVGLRQVMDLYFVLQNSEGGEKELSLLRDFRLVRFARAMMWLLHERFGLKKDKLMTCGTDEKEGRFLLNEIMQMGNFGQSDKRYQYKRWFKLRHHIAHGSHLLVHYPSEVMWTPVWLMYHKVWKWRKKRELRRMIIVNGNR